LNSQTIELLDSDKLARQLIGLERRTARGGRETIDHAPNGKDDTANCVAGVATIARRPIITLGAMRLEKLL